VRLLDLRLLPQLIQKKSLLPHLDVVAEEECDRELKKEEEIGRHAKTFLFYSQAPDAEGRVAQDENINIIFIHGEVLVPFFEPPACPAPPKANRAGSGRPLPVKIESSSQTGSQREGSHSPLKTDALLLDQMKNETP